MPARRHVESLAPLDAPIERQRLYAQIADRLLALIGNRRLKPGDALPTERELTQTYRVGRSSVREALRMLESRGLIRSAGMGTFVVADYSNPLNDSLHLLLALRETSLRELFEVRKILEVEAAALAALRHDARDLGRMAQAIEEMVAGLSTQDRYIAADLQFHLTVVSAARNRVALHMMQAIRGALQDALASIYHIPGSPQQSIAQHRQILAAIASGDPSAARQRMWEHLARVESDIATVLGGRPHPLPAAAAAGRRGQRRG